MMNHREGKGGSSLRLMIRTTSFFGGRSWKLSLERALFACVLLLSMWCLRTFLWFCFGDVFMAEHPLHEMAKYPFWKVGIILTSQILALLFIISYVRCAITDPGVVPEMFRFAATANKGNWEFISTPRPCMICAIYKPPRAHHCSTCGRCVLMYDHHCPWTARCIGKHNMKYFLLLCLYGGLLGLLMCLTIGPSMYIGFAKWASQKTSKTNTNDAAHVSTQPTTAHNDDVHHHHHEKASSHHRSSIMESAHKTATDFVGLLEEIPPAMGTTSREGHRLMSAAPHQGSLIALFIIAFFFQSFNTYLFVKHFRYIMANKTNMEVILRGSSDFRSRYDFGFDHNMKNVFGDHSWLHWLLPLAPGFSYAPMPQCPLNTRRAGHLYGTVVVEAADEQAELAEQQLSEWLEHRGAAFKSRRSDDEPVSAQEEEMITLVSPHPTKVGQLPTFPQ